LLHRPPPTRPLFPYTTLFRSAALLYKVVHEPPELGEWDGELRELTDACLNKDPSARPTPAELAGRLAPEGGAARMVAGGWLPGPDRKSTRLNSSHVKISYAVF